jgi:small subunit ribosomal protein S4
VFVEKGNTMSKRESSKYKIDRRMGENIWGRPKSPVNRREYGPGQHGQRRKGKLSDFGVQLRAKQKLKGYYGDIREKQFRDLRRSQPPASGDTPENLIGLLESRLDAIVYRAKFVPTIWAARQFVNHGHVTVNGVRVEHQSYRCKPGDVIEVRQKSKELVIVLEAVQLAERDVPDYLDVDHNKMTATFVRVPRSRTCPIRCRWNRTSWSSSTRAKTATLSGKFQWPHVHRAAISFSGHVGHKGG